jgi:hypothetical protein
MLGVVIAVAALYMAPRLLAPRRDEPATDFAGLAVAAARRIQDYGARHGDFRGLRADSVMVALPAGTGLRVSESGTSATVTVLRDGRARCSVHLRYGETLTQPRCVGR